MKQKISLYLQAFFYCFAGVNHFINPDFYFPLIPEYLSAIAVEINFLSGVIEVAFGLGLLLQKTRKWVAIGIVLMLVAFIPSHVYFIQVGGCIEDGLCAPMWVGWIRLVLIHPLLIWWAYSVRNIHF